MTPTGKSQREYDAVIIGSGPNGLAAAITIARRGLRVLVVEGSETIGGGVRSAELTLPGFTHDVCSAVHPLALTSPFFQTVELAKYGVKWIHSPEVLAHPLDGGRAVLINRDLELTAKRFEADANAYRQLFTPFVEKQTKFFADLLRPLRIPKSPLLFARFGLRALRSAQGFARQHFRNQDSLAVMAGLAAHGKVPLQRAGTASFAMALAVSAHTVGWPIPQGGSQRMVEAMGACLSELGGEIVTGQWVSDLQQLPSSRVVLLDVSPESLLEIAGDRLPDSYVRKLQQYRYGPGVFKVDWALDAPIPWENSGVGRAATVHLGGTLEEIVESEKDIEEGRLPSSPYTILVQPSLFDPSRSPAGQHTAWAYCHVPNGSIADMRGRIEAQVERFAPGFRSHILAAHTINAAEYAAYNPNYVGGDINSGLQDLRQTLFRPLAKWDPYATPLKGIYLCSSATPPGGGVHGMCGYLAARSALRRELDISSA